MLNISRCELKCLTISLDLSGLDEKETENVLELYFKHGPKYQVNFDISKFADFW